MKLKIITIVVSMLILLGEQSYANNTMLAHTKTGSTPIMFLLISLILTAIMLIVKIKNK